MRGSGVHSGGGARSLWSIKPGHASDPQAPQPRLANLSAEEGPVKWHAAEERQYCEPAAEQLLSGAVPLADAQPGFAKLSTTPRPPPTTAPPLRSSSARLFIELHLFPAASVKSRLPPVFPGPRKKFSARGYQTGLARIYSGERGRGASSPGSEEWGLAAKDVTEA
jgi:hypothetical protein